MRAFMNRHCTNMCLPILTLFAAVAACDDVEDPIPAVEDDDESETEVTHEEVELATAFTGTFFELALQERWDNGLEEFLDLSCGEGACPWVWSDVLEGFTKDRPPIPDASGADDNWSATTLTATQDPAAAGTKTVKVTSVHCIETQDIGDDEPYLLINGVKVWSATNVKNGSSHNINKSATTQVLVELWEQDVSTNDKIGAFTVLSTKANGNHSMPLTGAGGSYRVYYTVSSP